MANSRLSFASKTTFDALAVDSGEDSDEYTVPSPPPPPQIPLPEPKPTKSALKKAARAARLDKQRQKNSKAIRATSETKTSESDSPSVSPPGSVSNPLEVPNDIDILPPVVSVLPPLAAVIPSSKTEEIPEPTPAEINISTSIPAPASEIEVDESVQPDNPSQKPDLVQQTEKKRQNILTRTVWGLVMIGTFIGLLLLGHAYMILLVLLCQTLVYREVTALFSLTAPESPEPSDEETKKGKDPWSTTLNWYFFAVTNYFLYGESIIYYFKHVVFTDAQVLPFATNHRIISFTLYTIGFVGFVMSLQKGYLKQQFGLFCWVHMTLLMIVVSSHFIVNNILEGLIWFWVPASLVICNDIFAYICGITMGRTPLIALSPKKTVEGFVGAFWCTMLFGVVWATYFMQFKYMICPVQDLGVSAWSAIECRPNPVFDWKEWQIWRPLAVCLSTMLGRSVTTISYTPYQFHVLLLSGFASLVAPFGGFFASGFKRAFNIKDFGHSIPGHGGMTDRMDCQFLMGVFTYVYYSSLIREHHVTVGWLLQKIVSGLTVEEQLELVADLLKYLEGQGISVPRIV